MADHVLTIEKDEKEVRVHYDINKMDEAKTAKAIPFIGKRFGRDCVGMHISDGDVVIAYYDLFNIVPLIKCWRMMCILGKLRYATSRTGFCVWEYLSKISGQAENTDEELNICLSPNVDLEQLTAAKPSVSELEEMAVAIIRSGSSVDFEELEKEGLLQKSKTLQLIKNLLREVKGLINVIENTRRTCVLPERRL